MGLTMELLCCSSILVRLTTYFETDPFTKVLFMRGNIAIL